MFFVVEMEQGTFSLDALPLNFYFYKKSPGCFFKGNLGLSPAT